MDYTFALQSKIHDKQVWLSSAANSLKYGPAPIAEFLKKVLALNPDITKVQIQNKYGLVIDQIVQGAEPQLNVSAQTENSSPTLSLTTLRAIESFAIAFTRPYRNQTSSLVDMVLPTFNNGDSSLVFVFTFDTDHWLPPKSGIDLPSDIRVKLITDQRTSEKYLNQLIDRVMDTEFVSMVDAQERHLQLSFMPTDPLLRRPFFILMLVFSVCGALVGLLLWTVHTTLLRRSAEAALSKLTESINAQSRIGLLGEVSLSIAHELNQPLTTIANYAAACEIKLKSMQDTSGELTEYLSQIRAQTLRASEVVSSVRNFVQKKQNSASLISIGTTIEKLEPILKMMAKDHKAKIEFDIDLQSKHLINADAILLEQVVINLVQNSLEAMETTAQTLRAVKLRSFTDSLGNVILEVADTGAGIPPQILHRVMEPYFSTKPKGLGIGLSFSRSVVEKFGGSIKFSPSKDRGTLATLTFPSVARP